MKAIRVPFSYANGSVEYTSDISTIAEQKIADVLTTIAGSRVMRYEYGASAATLLFDVFGSLEFSDFKVDAIQELQASISNISIIDIRIDQSFYARTGDPSTASLLVVYRLPLGVTEVTRVQIAVPGLLTEDSLI